MALNSPDTGLALIAREAETAALAAALRDAQAGHGRLVLLSGEPGIGKSTLARWLAAEADAAGLPVCWGFAWEGGGAPAYWPWTQVLRALCGTHAGDVPQMDSKLDPQLLEPLAKLVPEWAGSGQDLRPEVPMEQARFGLMEAVRALLARRSTDQPLVVILEDLHAADSDSLQLLLFIAQHLASLRILLLVTFRESEARLSEVAEPLWRAARHGRHLPLACFDAGGIGRFVVLHTGDEPDPLEVERLRVTTEGNPLFLAQLVGLMARGEGGSHLQALPATVSQVIFQHLEALPPAVFRALSCASVIGREFNLSELEALCDGEESAADAVQIALKAQVIRAIGVDRYRFCHMYFRDVLYQALDTRVRISLHVRRADFLEAQVRSGMRERWRELALHLEACGVRHRARAVKAWREAAAESRARLAFEDAAASLARALEIFGEGPGADPAQRCALVLELARARMEQGDFLRGKALCRTAFDLAAALEDAELVAQSALVFGMDFQPAHVDQELCSLLRRALDGLDENATGSRARVMARLAGALQPAPEPEVPMAMAREAIALARTTGDERVLYETLKSAISALMDFAPAKERAALNREYAGLAESLRDIGGEFRARMRLTIDAAELGDPQLLDESVQTCARIAERIGLPHYRWRVESLEVLRHTIRGNFAAAAESLRRAWAFAETAGDSGPELTLPIQQFVLLRESRPPQDEELRRARDAVLAAFVPRPGIAHFVKPLIATHLLEAGAPEEAASLMTPEIVNAVFASGERSSCQMVAEYAVRKPDRTLAEQAAALLASGGEFCGNLGLMGTAWIGPVGLTLGKLAALRGQEREAVGFFRSALVVAERMGALPRRREIHLALATLLDSLGEAAAAVDSQAAAAQPFTMQQEGEFWCIRHDGALTRLKDSKGLQMLSRLVESPGREFHAVDLSAPASESPVVEGDSGAVLDEQARRAYRDRLQELAELIEEAEALGDIGRLEDLRGEQDSLTREISRAFGLGGRQRRSGSATERARVNVQRRLRDAISRIAAQLPNAGKHLENSVKTGIYCSYTPS